MASVLGVILAVLGVKLVVHGTDRCAENRVPVLTKPVLFTIPSISCCSMSPFVRALNGERQDVLFTIDTDNQLPRPVCYQPRARQDQTLLAHKVIPVKINSGLLFGVLCIWILRELSLSSACPQVCRDQGFHSFTTVSFIPAKGFSVRDADNQETFSFWCQILLSKKKILVGKDF